MKCQECNKEVKNIKALTTHIQFKHDNKQQYYYDKWLKSEIDEGKCKVCDKLTKFDSMQGYQKYCGKECMKKDYSIQKTKNNPMHSITAKQNLRNTNLKKYNVSQNTKRPEIKEQIKQTCLLLYGVENVSQNEIIKNKALKSRENTCMAKFGVKSYLSVDYVKEKIQNSILKNNNLLPRFKFTKYKNTKLWCQGTYELDFLEKYYDKYPDIKRGPTIKYNFNEISRLYFPDFYIPSLNLIIECKNSYLAKKDKEQINAKEKAAIANGFNYVIIIDKNYTKFELLFP